MPRSNTHDDPSSVDGRMMFELLNEVGIIAQLSRALLESRLEDGLTIHHFTALNHLVRLGDGRTPIDMARVFQVPKTSMSHTLAGLEKRALIRLIPNPADGRGKLVMLTDAGRALRERAINSISPDIAQLLPQFGLAEAQSILPSLRKLRALLDRARDL
ncbi:MarR family winged helix-turn-helix transcriptional regulator [Salinispirillum marinum]|uniref:MarR family winged helix-turn-helix transcriptional regulator n=2 Tax=Saccharospirillaceae TaxID=255527 RepID=A0ABV8BI47_9GAMM